ncbi:MAG: His-Xaa-Ser system protein HxsD [Lentisphaeria bacterium]|nr:His-Xaa-Ser system protein HxsD [Lentisphaeria bacterium]
MTGGLCRVDPATVSLEVDPSIYGDAVISRVLYWLVPDYLIGRNTLPDGLLHITLHRKAGEISQEELAALQERLNRDFIDCKLREIIERETRDIRTILYVKAFADFEEPDGDGETQ